MPTTENATDQLTIRASSMLYAQGFTLTPAQRADLVAIADRRRVILNETYPQRIVVPVLDTRSDARIGSLEYYF
jgi:hypothetical protein